MSNIITILNNDIEYKPSLRHPMLDLFGTIQNEVLSIIEFLGYDKDEYIITPYPLTIEKIDGSTIPDILSACIKSRLGTTISNKQLS